MGGTCVIRGCVPKKLMVFASAFPGQIEDARAYGWDVQARGFDWIAHDDASQSVLSWLRRDDQGQLVVVLCNLTPLPRPAYRIGVPVAGEWREIINTDAAIYGGSGVATGVAATEAEPAHGQAQSLRLTLPPLACVMLAPAVQP